MGKHKSGRHNIALGKLPPPAKARWKVGPCAACGRVRLLVGGGLCRYRCGRVRALRAKFPPKKRPPAADRPRDGDGGEPVEATEAGPGTAGKVDVMAARAARGESLFSAGDARRLRSADCGGRMGDDGDADGRGE